MDEMVVRHEMLHDLIGHPPPDPPFGGRLPTDLGNLERWGSEPGSGRPALAGDRLETRLAVQVPRHRLSH